jgi:hypothetical protein
VAGREVGSWSFQWNCSAPEAPIMHSRTGFQTAVRRSDLSLNS